MAGAASCDTLAAVQGERVFFAKNSDRPPNEEQEVIVVPSAEWPEGSVLRVTYITIPQVRRTNRVLLCKPRWMWGAEIGCNQHGLCIGNEAIFTKKGIEKKPRLLGMDLLRLALERASTALEGLQVITSLLETHGQGGNCFDPASGNSMYYNNSFILADPKDIWVIETLSRHWIARRVVDHVTLSNVPSIQTRFDRRSKDLLDYFIANGWCLNEETFDFSKCADFLYTRFGKGSSRRACTSMALSRARYGLSVPYLMQTLRAHGSDKNFRPWSGPFTQDICMHASWQPSRISQTTASMVSVLSPNVSECVHFVTGTSAPCLSVFKPVWLDGDIPANAYQPFVSLWRTHEVLHRHVLADYARRSELFKKDRQDMEQRFVSIALAATQPNVSFTERLGLSLKCWTEASQALLTWRTRVIETPVTRQPPLLYLLAWHIWSRRALLGGKVDMHLERYRFYMYILLIGLTIYIARRLRDSALLGVLAAAVKSS